MVHYNAASARNYQHTRLTLQKVFPEPCEVIDQIIDFDLHLEWILILLHR